MRVIAIASLVGLVFFASPALARCPAGSSFPWNVSDQQGASQTLFVPTTKTVVTYRVCVSERVGNFRNSRRARKSNVDGLALRLACGIDGKDMTPPCVTLPLTKTGTCTDVRTEGTIILIRTDKGSKGRAEGVACRIE